MSMRDNLSWSRELIGAPITPAVLEDWQRRFWAEHREVNGLSVLENPMKVESWVSAADKSKWKIVRRDDCTDVEGEIIAADEDTGEACVAVDGQTRTLSFGPRGIRIVGRR